MHPVENAEEGRLSASGRADERRNPTRSHREVHSFKHLVGAEPRGYLPRLQGGEAGLPLGWSCDQGGGRVLLILHRFLVEVAGGSKLARASGGGRDRLPRLGERGKRVSSIGGSEQVREQLGGRPRHR